MRNITTIVHQDGCSSLVTSLQSQFARTSRFVHITLRLERKDKMKASGLLLATGRFSPLSVWRSSLCISRSVGLSHGSDESLSCSAVAVSDLSSRAAECLCECFLLNSPSRRSHRRHERSSFAIISERFVRNTHLTYFHRENLNVILLFMS